ncbi:MAG: ATP-binding cassette domain-containing protein [Prevotella sp.]|jgi:molybdate transport system ATP-binding protein|nr:ATP-binding cassette domain-containing protein [Prevotella sp.]
MGKVTVIAGRNGSGKTLYIEQLRRKLASDSVRYIAFTDSYGVNVDGQYYLQLRWNQHDIDHETPTVGELLQRAYLLAGEDTEERRQMQQQLYSLFHMDEFLDKYIITLSSGELRKFQLTKTLFANPRLLIMDNPFIGLDAETRDQLKELLQRLAEEREMEIMLVIAKTDDIPEFANEVKETSPLEAISAHVLSPEKQEAILSLPYHDNDYDCQRVVDMKKVCIRYGERTILKDVDWTVMNGERWALSGQNGSGKSTLLSLICADNPQSYACDITLFDRPRGSGESIWDIKKHIGYVSPEMHRSYKRNLPAIRIVASGLMDSIGLYAVPNAQDYEKCRWWLDIFGIGELADRPFLQLSSGEQRLVLLARAFVKDPQLLILDEPLHGLDLWNRRLVKDIIETFCQRRNKTMIMVTHYQTELPNNITHQKFLARNL